MKRFCLILICLYPITIHTIGSGIPSAAQETISLAELEQRYDITSKIVTSPDLKINNSGIILSKGNQEVGCIYFFPKSFWYKHVFGSPSCHISYLWVNKKFRHKGIGTTLLSAAIKNLETTGRCSEISLNVSPFDTEQTGFESYAAFDILKKYYQRFGFKEITPSSNEMKRTSGQSHTSKN